MSDLVDLAVVIIIGCVIILFGYGLYTLLTNPIPSNFVYDCRNSCQQLQRTANERCYYVNSVECFTDCLELVIDQ